MMTEQLLLFSFTEQCFFQFILNITFWGNFSTTWTPVVLFFFFFHSTSLPGMVLLLQHIDSQTKAPFKELDLLLVVQISPKQEDPQRQSKWTQRKGFYFCVLLKREERNLKSLLSSIFSVWPPCTFIFSSVLLHHIFSTDFHVTRERIQISAASSQSQRKTERIEDLDP